MIYYVDGTRYKNATEVCMTAYYAGYRKVNHWLKDKTVTKKDGTPARMVAFKACERACNGWRPLTQKEYDEQQSENIAA